MRKFALIFLILTGTLLCVREIALLPDGKLHLHVLDVGQGDAILIVTPSGKQILVDGGPDLSVLTHLSRLLPFFDRTIELLIVSHGDSDHITGLPALLDRYHIDAVLMADDFDPSNRYRAFRQKIFDSDTAVIKPNPAVDIDLGDGVILDVIWPKASWHGSRNDRSIVARVLYKDHSILLAGDIEQEAEHAILAEGSDVQSDILKVPHHGSRTSSSTGFLIAVDPEFGIISAGRNNRFGHPHREVVDRYHSLNTDIHTTAEHGVLSFVFP